MEIAALISHLLHYVLAVIALYLCIKLFRRDGNSGWLFVGVVFQEPFLLMMMRALRGRSLLNYRRVGDVGADGALQITYSVDLPILHILGVIGLFLLLRQVRRS